MHEDIGEGGEDKDSDITGVERSGFEELAEGDEINESSDSSLESTSSCKKKERFTN